MDILPGGTPLREVGGSSHLEKEGTGTRWEGMLDSERRNCRTGRKGCRDWEQEREQEQEQEIG